MKMRMHHVTRLALATALMLAATAAACADTLTVTSAADDGGPDTLRAAISLAQDGDTIIFDPILNGLTIRLSDVELYIDKDLTITGPGIRNLAISGHDLARVFEVASGAQATLSGLTIEAGNSRHGGFDPQEYDHYGGNILNFGELTLSDCFVSADDGAWADVGGGIANFGTMSLVNCKVSGNESGGDGGGIYNAGLLTLDSSKVSGNSTRGDGGGIFNDNGRYSVSTGTLILVNSSVTSNKASDGADIYNLGDLTVDRHSRVGKTAP